MTDVVIPTSTDAMLALIAEARRSQTPLCVRGAGSRLDALPAAIGTPVSMLGFSGIVDHQPDDLTVTVRAGTTIGELEGSLVDHRQSAVLPETDPDRTIGGVVSSGDSGHRRLRYGPTSDRVLGVTLVTGYGEVVSGGGALVKNVTGYDLPRLVTGSHGELGMIATVTMKLWPTPPRAMTFTVDDAYAAHRSLYKPLAVIDTEVGARVYVEGSDGTIADARARIGDDGVDGLVWPTPVAADVVLSIRVPARSLLHATEVVRGHGASEWRANVGVGVLTVGFDGLDEKGLAELRDDIAGLVGIVVVERWPHEDLDDRWGVVPEGIEVQRRLKALFDPDRILNLGQLPGDL